MTRDDVNVDLRRVGIILATLLGFVGVVAAVDSRYAKQYELQEVREMTLDVLCSKNVDPTNRRCNGRQP